MDFKFHIPLDREDLLRVHIPGQYSVRDVCSISEIPSKMKDSQRAQAVDGCAFILDHFDTFYSILHHSKQLETRVLSSALQQVVRGLEQFCDSLSGILHNDIHPEFSQKTLNITKMLIYVFEGLICILEDQKSRKDLQFDLKGRKKNVKKLEETEILEEKIKSLKALYSFLYLPLQKLWDPPTAEEEFVNLASNVCYKLLEDSSISSSKMKPLTELIFQILGTLIVHYQHGLSCTLKIVQLLKLYEHLCVPLAEGVVILVKDYGCRGFIHKVIGEINVSDSIYDPNGAKFFSIFLLELAKNAADLVMPNMGLLLPYLESDQYIMRNCVLDVMGEIVIHSLTSESLADEQRETRDLFLNNLQEHLLDCNAFVRCKALKTWQRIAQEGCIPVSRFSDLLIDAAERLGDVSWSVVRYAVQLVKSILESNPFGGKVDLKTMKEKLEVELKKLEELQEAANNINNMSRPRRWEAILPEVTLAVEEALQKGHTEDNMTVEGDEKDMLSMMQQISCCINGGDYKAAVHLVRGTEKMFPGAADLRKDNGLKWQVDYFLGLMKKIYVDMDQDMSAEAKQENKENVLQEIDPNAKKSKKRRLQDLHPDSDAKPELSDSEKAVETQSKIVQFLKDSILFSEEMLKAVGKITSLLHCGQVQCVQDTIEFLTAASLFGFEGAKDGIRHMLLLVWSGEQVVKENVAAAYKTLYLQSESDACRGRARAVQVVQNLCNLLISLGQNERAALEIIVKEWVSTEILDKACIQVMWERFTCTLKDTTPQESHAALQLLCMVGGAKPKVIETNLDVIVSAGHGAKGERNFNVIKDTCEAFLRLVSVGQTTEGEPLRFSQDHLIFTNLIDVMKEGFCLVENSTYQGMAEEAMEVIYQLSEQPDVTCEHLLMDFVSLVIDKAEPNSEEPQITACPTELLSRLIFFIGHTAYWQWLHLDKSIFRELKRRNQVRELYALNDKATNVQKKKAEKKGAKNKSNDTLQHSLLSASHTMLGKQEMECDEIGGDIAADDAEAEYIHNVCEKEIVTGNSILSKLSTIVVTVCENPHKYTDVHLQTTASLALTKLMLVSSEFCDQHLQLVFTMMEKALEPQIRSNLVYAVGDLVNRFPNLIEPWTKHIYMRLRDKSSQVRLDTIIVLKHLITNEMVKVRGQISDLALCLVDPEPEISRMSTQLFEELSKKGNTLYNVMPDIISRLSCPSSEVQEDIFQTIMKFLMQLIQKDRQMESLVDKLCQRFRASTNERQWSDLAYCLGLMQYSDRSLRRLLENLPCYAEKLTVPSIYDTFNGILLQAGRTQKPERLAIVEEIQLKLSESLRKGIPTSCDGNEDNSSQIQDEVKHTPFASRQKLKSKPPASAQKSTKTKPTRGRGRPTRRRQDDTSSEDSDTNHKGSKQQRGGRRGRRPIPRSYSPDSSDSD